MLLILCIADYIGKVGVSEDTGDNGDVQDNHDSWDTLEDSNSEDIGNIMGL